MTRAPRVSESQAQRAFVAYVRNSYAADPSFRRELFFSSFNGAWLAGARDTRYALMAKAKAEGLHIGTPDLFYLQPRGRYPYLVIEMKAEDRRGERDGGVSPEQAEFLRLAEEAGAMAAVCYGYDDAMDVFDMYMREKPPQ